MKRAYYPVFLNVKGKRCVVAGGGDVALRKVRALVASGADVRVIADSLSPELIRMAEEGEIEAIERHYRKGDLKGAFVAVAATDDGATNLEVASEAREKNVLVNVVDDAGNSDFIVPSCINRGDITIAVSTSGLSPALARKVRTRLEAELGDEYADLALLVNEVRGKIRGQGLKVDGDRWQQALDLDVLLDLLKKGDKEKARTVLFDKLKGRA